MFLPETKKCNKCGKVKSKDEFGLRNRSPDGLYHQCKERKNTDQKDVQLQYYYGISVVEYELMFKKQNGVCKICKQPEIRKLHNKIVRLSVDHCHKPFKIRGLLCNKCNVMLGFIENNPELLKEITKYLKGE